MKIPYRIRKRTSNHRQKAILIARCIPFVLVRFLFGRTWYSSDRGENNCSNTSVESIFPTPTHPFYELDNSRFLVLYPSGAGINNQLQCLNVAANLAIAYNRTLMLQANAYIGSYHGEEPIPFHELFDVSNVRLSIALVETLPIVTHRIDGYDPERMASLEILIDPFPSSSHLAFRCSFGDIHHSLPDAAPHRDEVLLPFHPIYPTLAKRVTEEIRKQVGQIDNANFRLMGIHVRQGDLKGYPAFVCSGTAYPFLSTFREGGWWLAACTNQHDERLSWDRLLRHLRNCDDEPGIPLCDKDYDAIFVATNDVPFVKSWNIPKLFVLDDFSFVHETMCKTTTTPSCNHIKDFLVEEMLLVLSHLFQPSAPSSITDIVLHHRLEEHGRNQNDLKLYEAYDNLLMKLKEERKGNILNWERLFESIKANR